MTDQQIRLVEMETRLAEDRSGAYRDELLGRFGAELQALKRQIDAGLSPADFEAAQKVTAALETAMAVVKKVWQAHHAS